jgi:hypothetical protein
VSGIVVIVGGFMVVMAVYSFIHEGRKAVRARRSDAMGAGRRDGDGEP